MYLFATNCTIAQIPKCTSAISQNAPFCYRNVHISVTKWCILGYLSDALWDLWDGSIWDEASSWLIILLQSPPVIQHSEVSLNSLAPGKFECNSRYVIFKQISVIDGWGISSEIALIWMSLDCTDDQSTLVQVMAWCRQATSHYLSQCWLWSLSPYGLTRPQWVKYWQQRLHRSQLRVWYGGVDSECNVWFVFYLPDCCIQCKIC